MARKPHQQLLKAPQCSTGICVANLELLPHFVIKMLQQLAPGLRHGLADLEVQFELELVKGRLDFMRFTATLINIGDAFLEIQS